MSAAPDMCETISRTGDRSIRFVATMSLNASDKAGPIRPTAICGDLSGVVRVSLNQVSREPASSNKCL